jgi:hypothetical protein
MPLQIFTIKKQKVKVGLHQMVQKLEIGGKSQLLSKFRFSLGLIAGLIKNIYQMQWVVASF